MTTPRFFFLNDSYCLMLISQAMWIYFRKYDKYNPLSYHLTSFDIFHICCCLVTKSCLTLCDPMDCSPPGCSILGILQARILEWVAISSSRELPDPGIRLTSPASLALAGGFFTTESPGKPYFIYIYIYTHAYKFCIWFSHKLC